MKVIIDIPEDMYNDIQKYLTDNSQCYALSDYELREVIRNGKSYEERPHGEWLVQRLQNGFDDVYCPFCNARPTRSEYGYYLKDKFCHECGADMRGGRE